MHMKMEILKQWNYRKVSKKKNREFITHCGTIKNKKISVISTGIGIDNIEIIINEINAIVNQDSNNIVKENWNLLGGLVDDDKTPDSTL